jgi:uncharacterized membrane protein (UPF0127 family)
MHEKIISFLSVCVFVGSVFFIGNISYDTEPVRVAQKEILQNKTPVLYLDNIPIQVELARTVEERSTGLSGRTILPEGTGMLFIMDTEEKHGFWMPDMYFSIDIIWMDKDMHVVDISKEVSPDSYPEIFTPRKPALFILEVPAGYAQKVGIKEGSVGTLEYIAQ